MLMHESKNRSKISSSTLCIAPGSRILVRDEEWLVRIYEPSTDGGHLIECEGVSELVRGVEASFLTTVEGTIEVLDPALTRLVEDATRQFSGAVLYIEALRQRSAPNDAKIRFAHKGVLDVMDFQFDPALIALKQPRPRIMIADAVGLGKTMEAGILATELIQRGRGKRILVVTLKSMLTQFQKEWWSRFSIPLVRLDSVGLASVRDRIPANHNPFNYYDKTIISMDTLKDNLEYRNYLDKAYWDIIVIDECHNVAKRARDTASSLRARLASQLSKRSDALILLSATPHDGSAKSFASLISLLDRTVIPDPEHYTPDDFSEKGLVVRRFKHNVKDQVRENFRERITQRIDAIASPAEEAAYEALLAIPFTSAGRAKPGRQHELQRIGTQKALFSSPAAAIKSTEERMRKLSSREATAEEFIEYEAQTSYLQALNAINSGAFSKYKAFIKLLKSDDYGWNSKSASDRIVVFSERIETLEWLKINLANDLNLKPNALEILHGGLPDTDQQDLVDRFGRSEDPIRILLCSDVASEGLNLHYFCHRIVHFDMPWSLMTYLQRNGRVDRLGQKEQPFIISLQTVAKNEKIRGDQRILEVLGQKDEQAYKNLGDPRSFLDKYDETEETKVVSEFMADKLSAEETEARMQEIYKKSAEADFDLFNAIFDDQDGSRAKAEDNSPITARSLFKSHFDFAKAGLDLLEKPLKLQWSQDEASLSLRITPPRMLKDRLRQIPKEAQDNSYTLCADPKRVSEAMDEARQAKSEDDTWPKVQYLWPQNPIFQWITDGVISQFSQHSAPVLRSRFLSTGEFVFVIAGSIPNRKGQPMVVSWRAVRQLPNGTFEVEDFDSFAERAKLSAGNMVNPGKPVPENMQECLPDAVQAMRVHMLKEREEFMSDVAPKLGKMLGDLDALRGKQMSFLDQLFENQQPEQIRRKTKINRAREIEQDFQDTKAWVHDTMEIEPEPVLQVVAGICGWEA
jgi:superfamily II DNA/RNA helicase